MLDPRMPSDPATPAWQDGRTGAQRWLAEAIDHLWPWSYRSSHPAGASRWLQHAGLLLGLGVTAAWVLAVLGQLGTYAIVAIWFGWSLYEVVLRLQGKRYIKEGPWWGTRFRRATVMDMLCYVGFKNLLLGASLFFLLHALGIGPLTMEALP